MELFNADAVSRMNGFKAALQTRNEALIDKMISESKRAKDNFTENDNEMKKLKHTGKMIALPTFTKKERYLYETYRLQERGERMGL